MGNSLIETGVDKLAKIVEERGKISAEDVATELGVSTNVVMEWAELLEENGKFRIEYHLTQPYIVNNKLSKKEISRKLAIRSGKKSGSEKRPKSPVEIAELKEADIKSVPKRGFFGKISGLFKGKRSSTSKNGLDTEQEKAIIKSYAECNRLIFQSHICCDKNDAKGAKKLYDKAREVYLSMDEIEKKELYPFITSLYKQIRRL